MGSRIRIRPKRIVEVRSDRPHKRTVAYLSRDAPKMMYLLVRPRQRRHSRHDGPLAAWCSVSPLKDCTNGVKFVAVKMSTCSPIAD